MSYKPKYFKFSEMHCRDGTLYPEQWIARWEKLVEVLDKIRSAWGSPLVTVSGYRTPEYNRLIGGARDSQHMKGTAADIRPSRVQDTERLHDMIFKMYNEGTLLNLGGLGKYPAFVHVDVRASDRLARWEGSRTRN